MSRGARLHFWAVLTLTLAALSLGPSFAHLLEAPPRLYDWPAQLWIEATVRHGQFVLFRDIGAPLDIGAILAAAVLVLILRSKSGFGWALAGTILLILALLSWFTIVSPANDVLAGWRPGSVPADFIPTRNRWEIGHMRGRRNQRTRLRTFEIVQTQAPPKPSLDKAIIGDPIGESTVLISSPEQRMLEAFRLRSEQANAFSEEQRRATAERLIAEYGSNDAAANTLWGLARANDWFREGEGVERYLRGSTQSLMPALNHAAFSLLVALP